MLDQLFSGNLTGTGVLAGLVGLSLLVWWLANLTSRSKAGKKPASLPEWLPGLGNAYQFVFHNMEFMKHTRDILKRSPIAEFWIGPKGVYLVTGATNTQAVLRNSGGNFSADELFFMALKQLDGVGAKDIAKFKADKSGRSHIPQGKIRPEGRLWEPNHRIFADNITTAQAVGVMTAKFLDLFSKTVAKFPTGQSKSIRLYSFMQQEMARCAITALAGEEILKQNPSFIEAMWKFDSGVFPLVFGVPRMLYSKVYEARDAFHEMGEKFLKAAWEKFDWNGPGAEADWEPIFGTRYLRTHSKFLKERGFALRSQSGMEVGTIWALNSNSIPVTTWALIELIKDKALFAALRAEVSTALDPSSSDRRKFDVHKLRDLPLLQSIYVESLRMHVATALTRELKQDETLGGYSLKKGHLVQLPTIISHFDESIWSVPGHPASEFWAERHITYGKSVDEHGKEITIPQFSMVGRSGGFFPYGGGISICPGRHFAKQEIMAAIALIVVNFDIELEGYVNMDGTPSDRGPKDDPWYCGAAAMPPDRDLIVSLTKL